MSVDPGHVGPDLLGMEEGAGKGQKKVERRGRGTGEWRRKDAEKEEKAKWARND